MQIKPLPPVEEVKVQGWEILKKIETVQVYGLYKILQREITQDRNQAYTSLVEGIEGMKSDPTLPVDDALYSRSDIDREVDKTLNDILEKVVKPLYGKE